MAYIFEEHSFKNHLRNNATESWFSTSSDNARYETTAGTRDLPYTGKPTVRVQATLKDPGTEKTGWAVAEGIGVGGAALGAAGGLALAPFTFGQSLVLSAAIAEEGVIAKAADEKRKAPENVYFTITGDNSEWVAYDVPVGGIKQVAENICKWSNEVYQERFETHAYQEQY